MIYFCADDYGVSEVSNNRIEECVKNGALNKISVLPNGEGVDFQHLSSECNAKLSLHLNLVEGYPLSSKEKVHLLIADDGSFKYSFIGLMLMSFSTKRKEVEKQIYNEIRSQIRFWKMYMGEQNLLIDSHQHTHMIPLIFKTLLKVIKDEGVDVEYLRIPAEPLKPFLATPSLYFKYSLTGLVKQWLLKIFSVINSRELKKSQIPSGYFMGVMFSGALNKNRVKKLLAHYEKLAEKHNKNIEIGFHPGYVKADEKLMEGTRKSFGEFYYSPRRIVEFDTLMNL